MLNRSEELQSLSKNEVEDEKLALQKALLYFENIHGRPVTKDEKGECLDVAVRISRGRIQSLCEVVVLFSFLRGRTSCCNPNL